MEILRWDERFSVGNKEMDFQHKMLLNFVNYLTTGSGKGYKHHEMKELMAELVDYTEYHFAAEEELLKEHPSIDIHRIMHAEFTETILHFEKQFKKEGYVPFSCGNCPREMPSKDSGDIFGCCSRERRQPR